MSPEGARERAERLLVECGDGMSPTNLDGILRHLGGKIEQAKGVTEDSHASPRLHTSDGWRRASSHPTAAASASVEVRSEPHGDRP